MRKLIAHLLAVLLVFLLAHAASAQQPKKVPRVGYLSTGSRSSVAASSSVKAFLQGLHELGYIEGKNIAIEYRYAEGQPGRYLELAAELVRLKVDVIFTTSDPAVRAAKKASKTIPIVFAGVSDPVAAGLVDSLGQAGTLRDCRSFPGSWTGKDWSYSKRPSPKPPEWPSSGL